MFRVCLTTEAQRRYRFHKEDVSDPSNFSEFSENLEDPVFSIEGADSVLRGRVCGLLASSRALKSDRDSAANRPSTRTDEGQDFAVIGTRLCVQ